MTIFSPWLTEIRGKRAVALEFQENVFDRPPRRVLVIEQARQANAFTLPFAWRFLSETAERHYPVIDVIAAPGVTVELEAFPRAYIPWRGVPAVNIIRVQDPAVIPRIASEPSSMYLLGSYEVAENPWVVELPSSEGGTVTVTLTNEKHFKVDRLPAGVMITHLHSGDRWLVEVPELSSDPRTSRDAVARFAFEIDLDGEPGNADRPLLKIVKTPEVDISIQVPGVPTTFFGRRLDPGRNLLAYHAIWEVDYIHQVPPQGAPLVPERNWRRVQRVRRVPSPEEVAAELERTVFDIVVGFIPVVGDAVDVSELVYGLITGQDRWGRKLSAGELALMGVGAVLPFVGSSALRGGRRLLQRFGDRSGDASDLIRRVREANLSNDDAALITRIEELIRAGRQPSAGQWAQAMDILRRIPGPRPTIDVLLNTDGSGFIHAELQEAYQRYLARQKRAGSAAVPPGEWARRVTSGRPRLLLEALLGPDYARRRVGATAPPVNLIDVPRPARYSDELLRAHREAVRREGDRLMERLDALVQEPPDPGAEALGLVRRQVNAGHFRIFKGNLAEMFSMDIQLRELQRLAQRNPGARLVRGVKVRLMRSDGTLSPARLFSDNVVVVERQGRLQVLAVFEVKAGFKGGQEATEQIFEWIEGRLTDGSQLVLPRGTTLLDATGASTTVTRERRFTWKPGFGAEGREVVGLANAERHLITARGASALGMDSAMGVAPRVSRHELAQSSAELDYLGATLLSGRAEQFAPRLTPSR